MSLQFILGTGADNHQAVLLDHAADWLSKHEANEVYFLVPNYNKFEQEKDLLQGLKERSKEQVFAATRTQVFSFRRFAWFMLQKKPDYPKSSLSETGAAMIFRQVLLENKDELTVLQGEVNKTGFIQQLYSLYQELLEGNVTSKDFAEIISQSEEGADRQLKLKDLSLIFSKFEDALKHQPLPSADYFTALESYLGDKDMGHLLLIVTGFSRFSARELQLLGILMRRGHLEVSLLLDPAMLRKEPSPLDLFYDSQMSYLKLAGMAKEAGVQLFFDQRGNARDKPPVLRDLLTMWEATQNQKEAVKHQYDANEILDVIKGENPKEEISWIARSIRRKAAFSGLRYKDIQLVVRDMTVYGSLIPTIFKQYEIPFYMDQKLAMAQHPLVELLNALFALKKYNYRLADILRFLRTELFFPAEAQGGEDWETARDALRRKIDVTENIALEYNFQGHFWTQEKDWQVIQYDFEAEEMKETEDISAVSNEVRRLFQRFVPVFFDQLAAAENGKDAAALLYTFLIETGAETQLLSWRDQEVARGNLEAARNHEQTWSALMSLLDEYAVIFGTSSFDLAVFQDILSTGMENLTYGMIPTALDQVRVNNLELARPDQAKVTYAAGLNDQVFPAKVEARGLLSPEDKQFINGLLDDGKYLIDETTQGMSREPFYAYLTFLSASEEVHLSYAANIDVQKDVQISPYLERICNFLGIPVQEANSLQLDSDGVERGSAYRPMLGDLNLIYRLTADGQVQLPEVWRFFEKRLKDSKWKDLTVRTLSSLSDQNVPVSLSDEQVSKMYGKNIHASVSRLESFYNCEYKYFATYGLKLKEREIYGLTPAATGDFYHEALDRFIKALLSKDLFLPELKEDDVQELTDLVLQEVFGEARFAILESSARMNYIRHQLGKTIRKVAWALQQQSRKTGMRPAQTEVLFGRIGTEKGIPGIELPLNNGGKLYVRGKIDRVDMMTADEKIWLGVVDYKSSGRSFDISEAYYGLAMQLVTYLDVALSDLQKQNTAAVHPAGAYYLHVQNPILASSKNLTQETLKKFKYDGLYNDDPQAFEALDMTLEAKENSLLFPLRKDKSGTLQKTSQSKDKFFSEAELSLLKDHNRANMKQAGERILSGEIDLNPAYKDKERIACSYCPYRSVCGFDVMLKENQYHRLIKMSRDEVLALIREKGADHE